MKQRVITAIVALTILGLVLFVAPSVVTELVIAALLLAGAWEWSAFLRPSSTGVRFGYVFLVGALIGLFALPLAALQEPLLLLGLAWWLCAFAWTFFYPTRVPAAVAWLGGLVTIVPLHTALMMLYESSAYLLLFLLLLVWLADSGAFAAGKLLGRVKLAPQISPGKTWEGVGGGLLAVTALVLLRAIWFDTDIAVYLPFCLAVAALSVVGDLTVSMFKRSVGFKDSGRMFPGHGGVLDRIDSIAAAAPLFVIGTRWLGI
jgi:phosphatidate cytidylyltransferase